MMVEKRVVSLILMDVEFETKNCLSLLCDEQNLLNYCNRCIVLYNISFCLFSHYSKLEIRDDEHFACIRGRSRENAS